jgi:ABC-2 type transport system ATP-binding protein
MRWLRDFLRSLAAGGRTILISSHVLAEIAQTVDEVVIIHRGHLIRQASMSEVEAMAAGATRVRSPDAERLASALVVAGLEVRTLDDGALAVGGPQERVGEVAAAHGVVLHELTTGRATLEEVFLELTGDPGERGA